MKKIISTLLSVLFLGTSMGYSVNKHYCGGKYKTTKISVLLDSESCCGGKTMKSNCCKDLRNFYKLDQEYDYNTFTSSYNDVVQAIILFPIVNFISPVYLFTQHIFLDYIPPPPNTQSLFLLMQQFLI